MNCTVWNERHRTRLAFRRPGAGAHRDIERGKVPSAARVAYLSLLEGLEFTPAASATTKGDIYVPGTYTKFSVSFSV